MVKKYSKEDPHAKREAKKYENPVPSRELIMQYLEEVVRPITFRHLLTAFDLQHDDEREGLRRRLIAMQRDGQVIRNRRGSFGLVKSMELISGRVVGHKDGFGFLVPDDGGESIFLPARQMRLVFTDDRVLGRVAGKDFRGRREATIVEVLERNTHQIVGRYYKEGGLAFVDPDKKNIAQDIIIPSGEQANATHGQIVVAEITTQPSLKRQPMGKIIEVLGDHLTPGMEVELAIRSYEIPFVWPDAVIEEATTFPKAVQKAEINGRRDLRELAFVTIDGDDAKDFDDAVYCERLKNNGWRLYVAIADVSHYVKPDTALDVEAQLRGNSVYFPAQVIPMLPEQLSNELCSLKPKQDRLVMLCEMTIDKNGEVTDYEINEAVIHSHARLTYTEVAGILNKEREGAPVYMSSLTDIYKLYKTLARQRKARGAIEFETTETKIVFSKGGKIERIVPVIRNDAHRLIEEAMLLANVTVAHYLLKMEISALYRIHEGPDADRLESLRDFLKAFGLRLSGGDKPSAMDYAKLLSRIQDRPEVHLIQTVMLRSLRQALYSPDNAGHFGLAYDCYCHFTSPIRRYPDLMVHRALKHLLRHKKPQKFSYSEEEMEALGAHCGITERRADNATRDATDWLKCEYMLDKVGQTFEGIIVDVIGFGIFIELNDIYVQGLVHITALANDYYHHDATHRLLRGKRTGKVYRLGDPIIVTVARVDLDDREIDFDLV